MFLLTLPHVAHASRVSGGCEAVTAARRPPATRGPRARGSGGRGSASKLPAKVSLLPDRPKWLRGLNQTVSGWTYQGCHGTPAGQDSRRDKGGPQPSTYLGIAELGKPHGVSQEGLQADRKEGRSPQGAEDVGGSERRPVSGRIGVAISPRPKGGRLPSGVDGREPAANRR